MIKLVIDHPGLGQITLEAERQDEMFQQAKFWLSVPEACPECGATVTLSHRHVRAKQGDRAGEEFDFYYLVCTGSPTHESKLGIYKSGGGFFYTGEWEVAYQQRAATEPIGESRAVEMHAALERAGVEKPTAFARGVLEKSFGTLAELTDAEAARVWQERPQ